MKSYVIVLLVFGIIVIIAVIACIGVQTRNDDKMNTKKYFKQMLSPEELRYADFSYTGGGITKLFIRTGSFEFKNLPAGALKPILKSLKINKDYKFVYFSDDDCVRFIKDGFPEYMDIYNALKPTAFKADIFRLLVLYKYGGVYNDLGHTYLNGMNEILTSSDEFASVLQDKKLIYNGFICSKPRHPLLLHILNYTSENIEKRLYGSDQYDITGPTAIRKALNDYLGRSIDLDLDHGDECLKKNNIHLLNFKQYGINVPYDSFLVEREKKHVQTKFPDYYKIMYPDKTKPHYGVLWDARNVYN